MKKTQIKKIKPARLITNLTAKPSTRLYLGFPPHIKSMSIPRDSGYTRIDLNFDVPVSRFTIYLPKTSKRK